MKKILSSNLWWIAIFFFVLPLACSGDDDDDDANDAAVDDDDNDGEKQQPCEEQNNCLPAGLDPTNNCGANNQCYMCVDKLCETYWLDETPSTDSTASEMFNLSWDGELAAAGCKYEMIFYSKIATDGSTVTCGDILGKTNILNVLFYAVPHSWSGQCRQGVVVSTQASLIPSDIEFLWLTNLYEGDNVGELGELIGQNCKELNGPEIDSSGGYPPGFQRDSDSLYKPSSKILPVD